MELWDGFEIKFDELDGREMVIVFPRSETENGKWVLKTEYFGAFPETEIELLKLGYHIAHIKNVTRWHVPEDTDARAKLVEYMHSEYGLDQKCVIAGMSCGGMQGIYFAAKYPQYVSCMYLDAPVINLLSCPADLGKGRSGLFEEFRDEMGVDISELLGYRNHPLDNIPKLIENHIPIILVSGDSDQTVPYEENGKLLKDLYEKNHCEIKTIIKKGGDHHPHGLPDNSPIIEFIEKHSSKDVG